MQVGHGHDERLKPLADALAALGGLVWRYSIDQGEDRVTSDNRLVGICTGRNLAHEVGIRDKSIHSILFLDTDVRCPEDLPERLLEVDHPMVGANVPAYCLDGPRVDWEPGQRRLFPTGADVREHWNTAGCLLFTRPVFRLIPWRWDLDAGLTDDPATQIAAATSGFGMTWVRHDVTVWHEDLVGLEHRGSDLSVIRP
jgi:hypothetical protein